MLLKYLLHLAKSLYNKGGKEILEIIRNVNLTEKPGELQLKNKIIISTRVVESDDSLTRIITGTGCKSSFIANDRNKAITNK